MVKVGKSDTPDLYRKMAHPFEHIAVAVTFSPRLEAVLAEAFRMVQRYESKKLIVIHIGVWKNVQKTELEGKIEAANKSKEDFEIVHKNDSDIEGSILSICKDKKVDLLIFGALRKENIFNYYMGSVARNLSRRAKCSLLMLTEPKNKPTDFERIVVNGIDNPKTTSTIETSLYVARHESCSEIFVVREVYLPLMDAGLCTDSTDEESDDIKREYLDEASNKSDMELSKIKGFEDITIRKRTIYGKPGYSIRNFAKSYEADLLVINSPDKKMGFLDRVFAHDIEHLLAQIPCNLLIVHSRRNQ